ncbi:MAG: hypothetical protein WC135_00980 [Bacteroidales bacterium]
MPIKYFRLKKKITINSIPVDRYIANIQIETNADLEMISEIIEKQSTMSRGDIMGVLAQLEPAIWFMLENGHPVTLGVLGTFYPAIDALSMDSPEKVTTRTIKRFRTIFKPSKYLKKRFKDVQFVLGDNKVREVRYKKKPLE